MNSETEGAGASERADVEPRGGAHGQPGTDAPQAVGEVVADLRARLDATGELSLQERTEVFEALLEDLARRLDDLPRS